MRTVTPSAVSIGAPPDQTLGSTTYTFGSWSDGALGRKIAARRDPNVDGQRLGLPLLRGRQPPRAPGTRWT